MSASLEKNWLPAGYDLPAAWADCLAEIAATASRCLVIGPIDAGKSSFCLLAANCALAAGRRPALVDTDPGQSDIGPPAALGLALFDAPLADLEQAPLAQLSFVGATTPVGHLLEVATGAARLADAARSRGAELVIVNTCGLVQGGLARALLSAKIRLLQPSHVVSVALAGETEEILAGLRGLHVPAVYRLQPSPRATSRSPEQRKRRRQEKFAAYFEGAAQCQLDFAQVALQGTAWLSGRPLERMYRAYAQDCLEARLLWAERTPAGAFLVVDRPPAPGCRATLAEGLGREIVVVERTIFENLLVGLLGADGEDIALGIITDIDFARQRLTVLTPAAPTTQPAGLQLGTMRVTPEGLELGSFSSATWG